MRSASTGAFTLVELLVVLLTLTAAALLLTGGLEKSKRDARLRQCSDNLKSVGLSFRMWPIGSDDAYPMAVPNRYGGSLGAVTSGETFFHFQVTSNELQTPKVLVCPTDDRQPAQSFSNGFSNTNLSYFVGVDARNAEPNMLLSGDRNVTNGSASSSNMLVLTTNSVARWSPMLHGRWGNISLADGSVQRFDNKGLANAVAHSGAPTNRIQLP